MPDAQSCQEVLLAESLILIMMRVMIKVRVIIMMGVMIMRMRQNYSLLEQPVDVLIKS